MTGEPLHFTRLQTNYSRYTTASLDRIDSSLPYEKGNVQWVHKKINMMKGGLSQETFIMWCRRVGENQRPNPTPSPSRDDLTKAKT